MRVHPPRSALALLLAASFLSCNEAVTPPKLQPPAPPRVRADASGAMPYIVISQVYGGGGNSGATYRNDFIELHNTTDVPLSVDGWSVQYASSAGTSWTPTSLTGTIPAGGYYLV